MTPTLKQLFEQAGWPYKEFTTYYAVSCPNKAAHKSGTDRKPSCIVWPGIARFKCYSCGHAGNIDKLFEDTDVEVPFFLESDYVRDEKNVELDSSILHFRQATEADLQRPAFKDRGWNPGIIEKFDLRFDEQNDMLVFPVKSPNLVGAVGRSAEGKRVRNYFGFFTGKSLGGLDLLTDNPKIAIVEGWTCLVNCHEWANSLGYDVVCTFTANISETHCRMISDTGKVIHFWFDQDEAGRRGALTAEKYIDDLIIDWEWDQSVKDVGAMSQQKFFKIFGESNELTEANVSG